ncbi:nuclear transport factor 2 family protein [Nodosilinea sp. P-1105]|uniref:YybH family protein n=1 Tax=Nodosilinea sp. P-1105 TaxID=2546229 RepID=UPI00146B72C4|nr:nuclear transport factor 2 family protein [Nodosilinea sp. P-1105]NMF85864.1 nuclear transport factor 2 family protein [Nodosilinea sp. P-1105]
MPLAANHLLADLSHATAERYFDRFNAQDFNAVAALFSEQGVLIPPFEAGIVGPEAIAQYLKAEATGMQAVPVSSEASPCDQGGQQLVTQGRVKTPLFTVNVRWTFAMSAAGTIDRAEIKLLASLQELLQFNRG